MSYIWRNIKWQVMHDDKSAFWLYGQVISGWNYYRVAITEDADAPVEKIAKRYLRVFLTQIDSLELDLLKKYPIEILAIEDDAAYATATAAYDQNL